MTTIVQAGPDNLDHLVPLFDGYRVFYQQKSDVASAMDFLLERMRKNESHILLAYYDGQPAGFTQLYTTFSSVTLQPVYILNDLYVVPEYRQNGIGEALLENAKELCRAKGYKGLALETAIDNPAQGLYERLGWKKDTHCFHYFWTLEPSN
ncbi:GNAT family N-acetyltransferase [Maribacter algicola]|uniref:GNAT family N-acetyltransferase n=1 Tax=Meishania litoralis TaxID=3434685 RepID=A0ACC7LLV9_9FLAO